MTENQLPEWAPRLPRALIRRLYELDAQGIYDNDLLDEVGWGLYHRCQSFIAAVEAVRGRAACPRCGAIVLHQVQPEEILGCTCGWQLPWKDYFRTIQRKQLSGADPVLQFFGEFVSGFPTAEKPTQKMLLIDRLLHGFHYHMKYGPTRATGVNLIEGNLHEVIDFLDRLTYGESSTPGIQQMRQEWRTTVNQIAQTWQDPRLQRPE
jgi:hypothetical protein